MIVKWDFYVRRKRIDVTKWIKRHNVKNYKELVETALKLDVAPPEEKVVAKYFNVQEAKQNDKSSKKPSRKNGNASDKLYKKSDSADIPVDKPVTKDESSIEPEKKKRVRRTRKKQISK